MWPRCPSFLNLSQHFPRDIRIIIYSHIRNFERDVVRLSHGLKLKCPSKFCYRAATRGLWGALKVMHERAQILDCKNVFSGAAVNGHLDIIKWAFSKGYKADKTMCYNASLSGHVEVLEWAKQNDLPWEFSISFALHCGHLNILKWAHENGWEWTEGSSLTAAMNGHLHLLQWAHEKQLRISDLLYAEIHTLKRNDGIIRWLCKNGYRHTKGCLCGTC